MTLETFKVSTQEVTDDHREEFVREYYGRIAMKMDVQFASSDSVSVHSKSLFLSGASVTDGVVSTLAASRTKALRNDANSDVVIMFAKSGIVLEECSAGIYIPPGDAVLTSLDRDITFHTLCENSNQVTLKFRREALAPLVSNIDDKLVGHLRLKAPGAALLLGYAESLFGSNKPTKEMAGLISKHVVELAALAIGTSKDGRQQILDGGVKGARLAAAKEFVMQRLSAPGLNASLVADHLGVSTRYLHMLFDNEGYSFSEFVIAQRLARAHMLLVDPRKIHLRIGDIANENGFSDLSTFNRAFRRKYGMKPTDCRVAAKDFQRPEVANNR